MVEQGDYYRVKELNWCISGSGNGFYAVHYEKAGPGKVKKIYMHRFIMDAPAGKLVDHSNNKTLDNRRSNLRIASYSENNSNRAKKKNTSSQYIGVHLNKSSGRWIAQIRIDGKGTHLGSFDSEIDAAKAYDEAAIKHRGVFARLNFPEEKATTPCLLLAGAGKAPRKNFPMGNSPAGFSDEKPNDAGASQGYANDCGASPRETGLRRASQGYAKGHEGRR
jgi:hypothetical protein